MAEGASRSSHHREGGLVLYVSGRGCSQGRLLELLGQGCVGLLSGRLAGGGGLAQVLKHILAGGTARAAHVEVVKSDGALALETLLNGAEIFLSGGQVAGLKVAAELIEGLGHGVGGRRSGRWGGSRGGGR